MSSPTLRPLVLAPLVTMGCSLLGLGDYDIGTCNAAPDACAHLCTDGMCSSCRSYQCNLTSLRCELRVTDADGDGDPPVACGGTDCDDNDPKRAGILPEVCDFIDNNCNGEVDEWVTVPIMGTQLTPARENATGPAPSVVRDAVSGTTLASMVQPIGNGNPCIAIASDSAPYRDLPCIAFPIDPGLPSQPYSRSVDAAFPQLVVTVYSRADRCNALALRTTTGGALDMPCSDGPATNPAFIELTLGGASTPVFHTGALLVTSYAAPLAATCADVKPAPLVLRQITDVTAPTPTITPAGVLSNASASTRPPALVALPAGVLVAAPDEAAGVAFWAPYYRPNNTLGGQQIATGTLFAGARSVDVDVNPARGPDGSLPFAAVAAIGCPPKQIVSFGYGALTLAEDGTVLTGEFREPMPIGVGGSNDAVPSVAWVGAPFDEWRVTWIADEVINVLRFTPGGVMIGESTLTYGLAPIAAAHGTHGNVVGVELNQAAWSTSFGCHR